MIDYSRYKFIKVDKKDKVAILTLNRPETLNAIGAAEHLELDDIFDDVDRDEEVNAVILTGAGRAFSAQPVTSGCKHDSSRQPHLAGCPS